MKLRAKLGVAALALGLALAGPAGAAEKWMIGDWHQHSFFTDGTNFMGDVDMTNPASPVILNGPSVTDPKAVWTAPKYKGVIPQGFRYGLDFQANSEHGGNRGSHDAFGRFWDDINFYQLGIAGIPILGDTAAYSSNCSYVTVDAPNCGSGPHTVMWRWQELIGGAVINPGAPYMSAFDWITTLRSQYPTKQIMTGMEWNVPGHEHASTGCLENNGMCIAEFEYRFDQNDTDGTGPVSATANAAGINWTGKVQTSFYTTANGYKDYYNSLGLNAAHNKAIDGLAWAAANHPNTMWVNPAHIERAGCGFDYEANVGKGGYSIAAIRDMNDTAPTVFFGMEGMPGHQKASNRGEVSATSCGGGTFGGAGTYIATVGGVWDNLLADGRKFYNFVSSDFHMTRDDFYPGEYAKTYVKVKKNVYNHEEDGHWGRGGDDEHHDDDRYTQQDILDGMRSGNSFAVHGDLITDLDFRVFHGASVKNMSEKNFATMGGTLDVEKGDKITVQIRFKDGATNNNGEVVRVHHVQLIEGRINPTKASKLVGGLPNLDFNKVDPTVAGVVATFDAVNWKLDAHTGYTTATYIVPKVQNDMFFRIRGTNLNYSVNYSESDPAPAYGTDSAGSPLKNGPGKNSAATAWADLWFYSNPIFVHTHTDR